MQILKLQLDALTETALRQRLKKAFQVKTGAPLTIAKINSEFLYRAWYDAGYAELINSFSLKIADGRGVAWSARYLSLPVAKCLGLRIIQASWQVVWSGLALIFCPSFFKKPLPAVFPGIEALTLMLEEAEKSQAGVFFLGATEAVVSVAVKSLQQTHPQLKIKGYLNGFDFQHQATIDPVKIINQSGAKLLFVAMGSPRQEEWIKQHLAELTKVRVVVGEGGTLTRIAKPKQLAPQWLNRLGLEWLWRTLFNVSETTGRSRFQRLWRSVPGFTGLNLKWKVRHGYQKN